MAINLFGGLIIEDNLKIWRNLLLLIIHLYPLSHQCHPIKYRRMLCLLQISYKSKRIKSKMRKYKNRNRFKRINMILCWWRMLMMNRKKGSLIWLLVVGITLLIAILSLSIHFPRIMRSWVNNMGPLFNSNSNCSRMKFWHLLICP